MLEYLLKLFRIFCIILILYNINVNVFLLASSWYIQKLVQFFNRCETFFLRIELY